MSSDWQIKSLEEVSILIGDGLHGTPVYSDNGQYYFVNGNNLQNGKIVCNEKTKKCSVQEYLKYQKQLTDRTILISINGTLGNVALYQNEPIILGKSACYINLQNNINREFVRYILENNDFQYYLSSQATGSTIKNASLRQIRSYQFFVPSIEKQQKIAKILGDIDRKTEKNNQINQTLEAMAQAIFKSWFVDFDPVHAKANAKLADLSDEQINLAAMRVISSKTDAELEEMAKKFPSEYKNLQTTASHFPDEFEESELGMIPRGWEVSTMGDEISLFGGGTPSTKNYEYWDNGDIYWATPRDMSSLEDKILLHTDRKITEAGLKTISSALLPIDTVLMSSRAPVGYLALAKISTAINQGFIAMVCDKKLPSEYVLQLVNSRMDEIKQRSSGTTFAEISRKNFSPIQIHVPNLKVLETYAQQIKILYQKIESLINENKNLIELRDSLLPKLLSGEIEV